MALWFQHGDKLVEVDEGSAAHAELERAGALPAGPEGEAQADVPLSKRTVAELRELADELGVEIPEGAKKAEIVAAIEEPVDPEPEGDLEGATLED